MKGENDMSEAIQDSIKHIDCDTVIKLSDRECFKEHIFCQVCGEDFTNYQLEDFLTKFAKTYLGEKIEYHIENNKLWVDTKNAAIYLGFYNKEKNPSRNKISSLCRENILNGCQKTKGGRWEVEVSSLYFYLRTLIKESTGLTIEKAAKKLKISKKEIMRRINLDRDNTDWINAETKTVVKYIVYLS